MGKGNHIGHDIIIVVWFYTCKNSTELVSHVLLHCLVSRELWLLVFSIIWSIEGDAKDSYELFEVLENEI